MEIQQVLEQGLYRILTTEELRVLYDGLKNSDTQIIQGIAVYPPISGDNFDDEIISGCAISYIGMKAHDLNTVGLVEEYFATVIHEVEKLIGKEGVDSFLYWFDTGHRILVFSELEGELKIELDRRANVEKHTPVVDVSNRDSTLQSVVS